MDKIIKDIKEQIANSDALGYDRDQASWGYEQGILLTVEEAEKIVNQLSHPLEAEVKPERANTMKDLLVKYSEFLEKHGYTDSDWREEEPTAIQRFWERWGEFMEDKIKDTIVAETLAKCRVEDEKIIYNPN